MVISNVRIASSRSDKAVEAPCIAVPPEMWTLVLGAGVDDRDPGVDLDLGTGRSDMSRPGPDEVGLGAGGGVADWRGTVFTVTDATDGATLGPVRRAT